MTVKADEIVGLFITLIHRAVERGMTADGKIERFVGRGIFHLPFDSDLAPLKAVSDLELKGEGIFFPALLVVTEAEGDGVRGFTHKSKLHIAREPVLSHRIALSLIVVESSVHLSHEGKQDGRVAVPVGRIRSPDNLVLLLLVIDAAELSAVLSNLHFQNIVFDNVHTVLLPVAGSNDTSDSYLFT